MLSITSTIRPAGLVLAAACCLEWTAAGHGVPEQFSAAGTLPQTAPLGWPEEDLSGRLMDGAHRFVERQIAEVQARSDRFWKYDRSSSAAWEAALKGNRDRLREIIGASDPRVPPTLERYGDDDSPAIVAETPRY